MFVGKSVETYTPGTKICRIIYLTQIFSERRELASGCGGGGKVVGFAGCLPKSCTGEPTSDVVPHRFQPDPAQVCPLGHRRIATGK